MMDVLLKSPPLIFLTILFAITSSITTFDKRMIQAKRVGNLPPNDPTPPPWVAGVYWVHIGVMLTILMVNWRYAITLFIFGFILAVLPVWETIGNLLISPFKPKSS